MAPPLQYSSSRGQGIPPLSYAVYGPGPVLTNVHHPGAPLSMVAGMHGLGGYGHPPLPPHALYPYHAPSAPAPHQDRPFKCDEGNCQQSFSRNHDLKRHKRIHMAVKPFPCKNCEKAFSRKDALKVSALESVALYSWSGSTRLTLSLPTASQTRQGVRQQIASADHRDNDYRESEIISRSQ